MAFWEAQSMGAFPKLDQIGNLTEQVEQKEMSTIDTLTTRNWMYKICYWGSTKMWPFSFPSFWKPLWIIIRNRHYNLRKTHSDVGTVAGVRVLDCRTAGEKSLHMGRPATGHLITGFLSCFSVLEQINVVVRTCHAALPKPIWTFLPKRNPPNLYKIKNAAIQTNPARTTNYFPLLHISNSLPDLPHSTTPCLATSLPSPEGRAGVAWQQRAQSISALNHLPP